MSRALRFFSGACAGGRSKTTRARWIPPRQAASESPSPRFSVFRREAPRQSSRLFQARGWRGTRALRHPSDETRSSLSAQGWAYSRACRPAGRRITAQTKSAARRKRGQRRRSGAARRECVPSRKTGPQTFRQRRAKSSRQPRSCRKRVRFERRRSAEFQPATFPSLQTTRPRQSTGETSSWTASNVYSRPLVTPSLIKGECKKRVPGRSEQVLVTVEHVCLGGIRNLADA